MSLLFAPPRPIRQQAQPISPTVGTRWEELTAGGLLVNQWEWDGTDWVGIQILPLSTGVIFSFAPNTTAILAICPIPSFASRVQIVGSVTFKWRTGSTHDTNNYYVFRYRRSPVLSQVGDGAGAHEAIANTTTFSTQGQAADTVNTWTLALTEKFPTGFPTLAINSGSSVGSPSTLTACCLGNGSYRLIR